MGIKVDDTTEQTKARAPRLGMVLLFFFILSLLPILSISPDPLFWIFPSILPSFRLFQTIQAIK